MTKAEKILTAAKINKHLGQIHLNLSAVFSQIGKKKEAIFHSKRAIVESKEEMRNYKNETKDLNLIIVISYHNIGKQEELNNQIMKALKYYLLSIKRLEDYGLFDEPIFTKFKNELHSFYRVIIPIFF